jgi:hypothetical protein
MWPSDAPQRLTPGDIAGTRWAHRTPRLRALGHDFVIATTNSGLGRYLDEMYAACVDERSDATTVYALVDGIPGQRPFALYVDGRLLVQSGDAAFVLSHLTWHVNQQVIHRTDDHVLLHAAAAARDGVSVMLPAAMDQGKTTLVAGLLLAGFDYLTDEAVAIDPATLDLLPYPKPLSIDEGSQQVLAELEPRTGRSVATYLAGQWHVGPQRIRTGGLSGRVAPSFVVFPRYVAGSRTRLEPLARAEAVPALMRQTFRLHRHGRRNFEVLTRVAARTRCFRLLVGDLDEACIRLARLVDDEVDARAPAGGSA